MLSLHLLVIMLILFAYAIDSSAHMHLRPNTHLALKVMVLFYSNGFSEIHHSLLVFLIIMNRENIFIVYCHILIMVRLLAIVRTQWHAIPK